MKRRLVAAAWIAGAIVPMVTATLFLAGCCVLPFHRAMHKLMPLCDMATNAGDRGGHAEEPSSPPAREKQEPVKRMASEIPNAFRLAGINGAHSHAAPVAASGYRSFISLGAIRCDRDVGLYVLVDSFRI